MASLQAMPYLTVAVTFPLSAPTVQAELFNKLIFLALKQLLVLLEMSTLGVMKDLLLR